MIPATRVVNVDSGDHHLSLGNSAGSTFHAMYSSSPLRWREAIAEAWPLTAVRGPRRPWRA